MICVRTADLRRGLVLKIDGVTMIGFLTDKERLRADLVRSGFLGGSDFFEGEGEGGKTGVLVGDFFASGVFLTLFLNANAVRAILRANKN